MTTEAMMKDAKFYVARRDTRWDPYPAQEPECVVAHDWYGFWELSGAGFWFKTPTSFSLGREITKLEAEEWVEKNGPRLSAGEVRS